MLALSILEWVVDLFEPLFVVAGYYIVAAAVLMERSIFVGLFVPGDLILAAGGVYASRGKLSVVAVVVIGILAATAGESAGYWLGRKHGVGMVRRIPLVRRLERMLRGAQRHFERHGGKTVALGRYATAAGAFIPFSAGVARMPYGRFLLFDVPAIVVWATAISVFGYVFGRNLDFVDKVLSRFGWVALGILALFLAGRHLRERRRGARREEAGRVRGSRAEGRQRS